MKKNLFLLLATLFFVCQVTYSQTENYQEKIKEINEFILEDDYSEALYLLLNLEKSGFKNPIIDYKIGLCYLHSIKDKESAIDRLKSATAAVNTEISVSNPDVEVPIEAFLLLGDAYMINNEFNKAQSAYNSYLKAPSANEKQKTLAQKRLKECMVAKLLTLKPQEVKIENAGSNINSDISNFNVSLSGDGKKMVFTKKLKLYDAVYYATQNDSGWLLAENITNKIGSDGEFIPTSLSYDGSKLLLYSFSYPNGYDLFECTFTNNKWSKIKKLPEPINSKYNDIDGSYASDGSIFFSSNRAESLGGYDIFKAYINKENGLYAIENIGNTINTTGDEKSPQLIDDERMLVFNSNNGLGMGGFDFYYATINDSNKWSKPLNLGFPFNTSGDDNDLTFMNKGYKGALARNVKNGYSDVDILLLTYNNFGNFRTIPVNGKVQRNGIGNNEIGEHTLIVINKNTNDTVYITESDKDGSWSMELFPGDFNLVVKNKEDVETQQKFTIPENLSSDNFSMTSSIIDKPEIKEIKKDTLYVADILFDFNQSALSDPEKRLLAEIFTKLKITEIKSLTLTGFTDALGNSEYNKLLSLQRANSVKKIFVEYGINDSAISTIGKGNTDFVAYNQLNKKDYPEGRLYNRRVEITVVTENPNLIIVHKDRVPGNIRIH